MEDKNSRKEQKRESAEIDLYIVNRFLTKAPRWFDTKKSVFQHVSLEQPDKHIENKKPQPLPHTSHKNQYERDHRHKHKS